MNLKGVQKVVAAREHHLELGYTPEWDKNANTVGQLRQAASYLVSYENPEGIPESGLIQMMPYSWNKNRWLKMCRKSYTERLIIAASLLVAEHDRLNNI